MLALQQLLKCFPLKSSRIVFSRNDPEKEPPSMSHFQSHQKLVWSPCMSNLGDLISFSSSTWSLGEGKHVGWHVHPRGSTDGSATVAEFGHLAQWTLVIWKNTLQLWLRKWMGKVGKWILKFRRFWMKWKFWATVPMKFKDWCFLSCASLRIDNSSQRIVN